MKTDQWGYLLLLSLVKTDQWGYLLLLSLVKTDQWGYLLLLNLVKTDQWGYLLLLSLHGWLCTLVASQTKQTSFLLLLFSPPGNRVQLELSLESCYRWVGVYRFLGKKQILGYSVFLLQFCLPFADLIALCKIDIFIFLEIWEITLCARITLSIN